MTQKTIEVTECVECPFSYISRADGQCHHPYHEHYTVLIPHNNKGVLMNCPLKREDILITWIKPKTARVLKNGRSWWYYNENDPDASGYVGTFYKQKSCNTSGSRQRILDNI